MNAISQRQSFGRVGVAQTHLGCEARTTITINEAGSLMEDITLGMPTLAIVDDHKEHEQVFVRQRMTARNTKL